MGASSSGDEHADVREASRRYLGALRGLDHETASSMWAEDALLVPSDAPHLEGGEAIRAMMADNYPLIRFVEIDVTASDFVFSGNVAVETTQYQERIGMPDGDDLELSGRFLFVWRREPSGEWKILRGMYNYAS